MPLLQLTFNGYNQVCKRVKILASTTSCYIYANPALWFGGFRIVSIILTYTWDSAPTTCGMPSRALHIQH